MPPTPDPSELDSNGYPKQLADFFKSLDYDPLKTNQGTVRTSYKAGGTAYNLYGIPAARPGQKSEILI